MAVLIMTFIWVALIAQAMKPIQFGTSTDPLDQATMQIQSGMNMEILEGI
mgnify:CR=1 FL=1